MTDQEEAIQRMLDASDEMLSASTEEYVSALQDKWSEFQSRLEADILKIHSELPEDASYADFVRFAGDKKISEAIAIQLQKLHVSVETDRMEALVQQYKDAYSQTAWVVDSATPPEVDIEHNLAHDSQIRQFVAEDWPDNMFVTRNAKEFYFLAQDIKKEVTLAMMQGQSVQELSKTLQGVIGNEDSDYKYRATRIARTELLRAANLGRQTLYDQNDDIVDDQVWVTRALTSLRLCEDCAERGGLTYDEVADLAEEQELFVDPPCHPNCGCTWMPKIKTPEELLGPELGKGMDFSEIKYSPEAYKSWAESNLVGVS